MENLEQIESIEAWAEKERTWLLSSLLVEWARIFMVRTNHRVKSGKRENYLTLIDNYGIQTTTWDPKIH